jgi:hypothetical protein
MKTSKMKNIIAIIGFLCCFSGNSNGQITALHHYPGSIFAQIAHVNLSRSGKKIVVMNYLSGSPNSDTLFFYNLDFSLWKTIPCPAISGYTGQFNFVINQVGGDIGVYYPSETLFNSDTALEVAVLYISGSSTVHSKILIINEFGAITDSIPDVTFMFSNSFRVFQDTPGHFSAYVSNSSGTSVYSLPGTLPCDPCGGGSLGLSSVEKPVSNILSNPSPNPSTDEVKITFTLPEGTSRGELQLYGTSGQKIKTFQVDNRFGYIMLDNSQLPSGVYYYNIVVNGQVSTTQKFVVIK